MQSAPLPSCTDGKPVPFRSGSIALQGVTCIPGTPVPNRLRCNNTEQGRKGSGFILEVRQALLFNVAYSAVVTGNAGCHCFQKHKSGRIINSVNSSSWHEIKVPGL